MTSKQQGSQGTGRHGHKDTAEPYPHTEASSGGQHQREHADPAHAGSKPGQGQSRGRDDLKSREYRDPSGEVHHHTKAYMEQHGGKERK